MKHDGARPQAAPRFFSRRDCRGWSLLELVLVLIVVAILTIFTVRTFQPKEALALEQAERLRNDLRHVQMLAITLNTPLQLKLGAPLPGAPCATSTYWVINCTIVAADPCTGAPNTPITDPATGRSFCVTLESGLALAGANLYFDPLGRPKNAGALINTSAVFTITGGTVARTVTVTPLTGFAVAQ